MSVFYYTTPVFTGGSLCLVCDNGKRLEKFGHIFVILICNSNMFILFNVYYHSRNISLCVYFIK